MSRPMIYPEIDEYIRRKRDDDPDDNSHKRYIIGNPSKSILKKIFIDEIRLYTGSCFNHCTIDFVGLYGADEVKEEFHRKYFNWKYLDAKNDSDPDSRIKEGVSDEVREALRQIDATAFKFLGYHVIEDFEDGRKPKKKPFDVFYDHWKKTHKVPKKQPE